MDFERTVVIEAPIAEAWQLIDDLEAVAACIPGVSEFESRGDREFDCLLTQQVGSVKAKFRLQAVLQDVQPLRSVVALVTGEDAKLSSNVKAQQRFELRSISAGTTEVTVVARFQITGRIATFGHRIIGAKAEQVVVETVENITKLIKQRRATGVALDSDPEGRTDR